MALVCLGLPPLHLKSSSPPCTERSPTLLFTTKRISFTQKTWRLQAEAKGFGGKSLTVSESNKKSQRDNVKNTGRNSGEDDNDTIPEVVFERMIVRILFFVGSPMAMGLAMLQVFDKLKEQEVWDVPLWLPFLMVSLAFGTSGVGLAYGTLSSSWDPDKKGSFLGWEEAQKNWPELWKEENESQK
ncbi:uncharacterized protein PAM68-like [Macadamia integrifolia]|uniref:uncharacterized protein PAM68-like n=1 Tax=Macadamia integrifolia TaxID=60698 RepID=UPI001C4F5F6E|nr:uncharacterized protein PAM68-like [Macadamia integrifolia]